MSGAGAAYTYDAVLRGQFPSKIDDSFWMETSVFGQNRSIDEINVRTTDSASVSSGIIYSNEKGEIFIEVSGQDPREISFIKQRPYIQRIDGNIVNGAPSDNILGLFTDVSPYSEDSSINLIVLAPDSDVVYNSVDLSVDCVNFLDVSGVNLYTNSVLPEFLDSSGLFFSTSGIGILNSSLNLRIRGK
jgi:hypothetical protein